MPDAGPADAGVTDGGDVDPPDCACQSTPAPAQGGQGGIPKRYRRGGGAFFMGAMLVVFGAQYFKKRQRKTLYARKSAERAARAEADARLPSASGPNTSVATRTGETPRNEPEA